MIRKALLTLSLISIVLCSRTFAQSSGYFPKGGPDEAEQVSLLQLIATPERFNGKIVRLVGYLHLEFEGNAIYFHRDDFDHAMYENSVWISVPTGISATQIKTVNDHYVICTARFNATRHGHMGMFAGELEDVSRLERWK